MQLFQKPGKEAASPRLNRAAFLLTLFLCIFLPLRSPLADLTTSAVKAIPDVLIVLLLLWYLVEKRLRISLLPQDLFFLGFLLTAFVSTCLVHHYSILRYVYQVRSIGIMYIFYYLLRDIRLSRGQMIRVVKTLQSMAVVLLAFGCIEKLGLKTIAFSWDVALSIYAPDNYARMYSLFYNPNTFGTFLVFTLLLSMVKQRCWKDRTPVWMYAVLITGLYLSMSRSSVMIFALALVILLVVELREHTLRAHAKRYVKTVIVCILSAVIVSSALSAAGSRYYDAVLSKDEKYDWLVKMQTGFTMKDRFGELGEAYMYSGVSNLRIFFFQTGLKVYRDYPILGTGFGTFGTSASLNYGSPLYKTYGLMDGFYADDQYITILVETGTIGTILFAGFLLSILWYYRKNPYKLFCCVAFGWFGIFFTIFEIQIAAMLFWLCLSVDDTLLGNPME
ncbi:MAG: O-antigen ligase family protein [Eubacteriales bacterium]|nr:O-antigen ligase family protein [Eubacteriales bacterium]